MFEIYKAQKFEISNHAILKVQEKSSIITATFWKHIRTEYLSHNHQRTNDTPASLQYSLAFPNSTAYKARYLFPAFHPHPAWAQTQNR